MTSSSCNLELKVWLESSPLATTTSGKKDHLENDHNRIFLTTLRTNQHRNTLPLLLKEQRVPLRVWKNTHDLLVQTYTMFAENSSRSRSRLCPSYSSSSATGNMPFLGAVLHCYEFSCASQRKRQHQQALDWLVSNLAETYLRHGIILKTKKRGTGNRSRFGYDDATGMSLTLEVIPDDEPEPVGNYEYCLGNKSMGREGMHYHQ